MPGDHEQEAATHPKVWTFVPVNGDVLNVRYLIQSRATRWPDPDSPIEITMLRGEQTTVDGDAARKWVADLNRFVPGMGGDPVGTPARVIAGRTFDDATNPGGG